MSDSSVRVEWASDHPVVLIVTLDNPPANAMKLAMFREIRGLF